MGDFNAKIGRGAEGELIGNYCLGERKSRGDRVAQFNKEKDFIIGNMFFTHHPPYVTALYNDTRPCVILRDTALLPESRSETKYAINKQMAEQLD